MANANQAAGVQRRLGSTDRLRMSSFVPTLEDGGPNSSYYGTPYRDSWMSTIVRNEAGKLYWVIRTESAPNPEKEHRFAWEALPDSKFLTFIPELPVVYAELDFKLDPQEGLKYSTVDPKGPSAKILVTDKTLEWTEGEVFHVKGKLLAPGVQVLFPTRYEGKAGIQLYYNQQFLVEGTFKGEAVKGFVLFEHHYDSVPWLNGPFAAGEGGMVMFGNQFEDGSSELGVFYCGGAMRNAIVVSGSGDEQINTNDVTFVNTVTEEGVLTDATYRCDDDSQWKFTLNQREVFDFFNIPGMPKDAGFKAISWGRFARVGETRKVIRSWAVGQAGRLY